MREAAVGFQCPGCVSAAARETRTGVGPYGGRRSRDPRLTTFVLIGLNVAVWLAITLDASGRVGRLVTQTGLGICSPAGDPDRYFPGVGQGPCLAAPGTEWTLGIATGGWWMPLSSMFSHESVLHLGMNMFVLFLLGPHVEAVFGRVRYLAVYLLAGLTGSLAAFWLSDPQSSVLGASGAIWGLMGAMFVIARRVGSDTSWLLQMIGLNVVITILGASFISWQGHLGGLVGGAAAAAVLVFAPRGNRARWQVLGCAGLVVLLAVGFVGRVLAIS